MEKLFMHTKDYASVYSEKLALLFPECVTEVSSDDGGMQRAIDFDKLRQLLAKDVAEGTTERYQFTWPDKKKAIRIANAPTTMTLRPCREESINFDSTKNIYIEGDNLEVLKLLREDYLGKVQMIYIDPPYNTGNDFVYEDDYSQAKSEYLGASGQMDSEGNRLVQNTESNGRFHTDWLNMIYPRLKVARDFLSEDGVIFISIDDREAENLIKVGNELFGEKCFVANISWQKTYSPRNDSKGIPAEKESIVVFSRTPGWMPQRLPRTEEMDKVYGNPDHDVSPWRNVDAFASDAKTHQGMVYAIQHPFTGELIYPYANGHWRYSQQEMLAHMNGWCDYELRELPDDEKRAAVCGVSKSEVRKGVKAIMLKESLEASRRKAEVVLEKGPWPKFYFTKNGKGGIGRKTYLSDVDGKMITNYWPHSEVGHTDEAKKELKSLFDGDIPFDTPKPVRLLERIIQVSTGPDSIVLDFFSGSATTAHAVIKQNANDDGNRRFILVQIPEEVDNKYGNLCEIGKERIRRAGLKVMAELEKSDSSGDLFSPSQSKPKVDIGFRVLKLDSSNMQDVFYSPEESNEATLFEDNIKPERTPEDLLFQVMLECNLPLSAKIETKKIASKEVFIVNDGYLIACFDTDVNEDVIVDVAKMKPYYFILRDSSLSSDNVADNFDQIFRAYSKETIRRVL